jgi:hypothetical protein
VLAASGVIAMMMEAFIFSEMSVIFYDATQHSVF